ncbi:serine/threonine-protein kinase [[Kitasatospora] papulosa]|uniref:serine/threonine-protein kinase n=1 Tax=[Kitasatospora] papulosa TaxID=1464011 RepID=UPI0037D38C38
MEKLGSGDPQRIGRYRLLGRLGAGGMGQVFLARSDRGRTVAIKLVRPELAEQQQFRDRFRAEVQAARKVGGSWTAPVLDAGVDDAVPWVATGYVAGPSLHRIVSGRPGAPVAGSGAYGPLPGRSVRLLGAGLAGALQDIHRAGLIHRDLKPSNVLVTIDGPRVIDFGIARALDTVADGGLTRTGAMIGSPGFMAPEQVRGERVTTACDVFCLGSVLAYAATGRLPFGAADSRIHALMYRIAQEEPDLGAGSVLLLVAMALLVAAGAGWGVYALTQGAGGSTASSTGGSSGGGTTGGDTKHEGKNADGAVPSGLLGTWTARVGGEGTSTRQLVVEQGGVGDRVLTLTAEGPLDTGGSYRCVFQADLESASSSEESVRVGASRITEGEPMTSCSPGKPTILTLLPDGGLRREIASSGESLTYRKSG